MSNLCANAIAYSPAGSPVRVELAGLSDATVVRVHNHGAPIAPEMLAQIFDPFRRGEGAEPSRGLGLGLYIVDRVVRAHGGSVAVSSSEGAGTMFTVHLPRVALSPQT
jgi:signal transduction histidine kinase